MTSCAPDGQPLNFLHMSDFTDYRGKPKKPCLTKGSISDYIYKHNEYSLFRGIIEKANMVGLLDDIEANCTLFVPQDKDLKHTSKEWFNTMDDGLARQIVNASIVNRSIDKYLITSSPVSYFYTRNSQMRMYVTNINRKTQINNCMIITKYDIKLTNGLIHEINGIIVPSDDHFMN